MDRWGCVLIFFTLTFTACDRQLKKPATQPTPTQTAIANKPVKSLPNAQPKTPKSVEAKKATTDSQIKLPEVDPLEVEGNITVAGSSTVFPLTKAIYQRFIEEGYAGTIRIESVGSSGGFRLLCKEGKIEIANASRAIKNEEVSACAARDRTPVEFRIGTDAIAIVVHPENNFLTNVTLKELAAIFTAQKWSDVNPTWPNERIQRFVPDADSGTLDFFVENVFNGNKAPLMKALNTTFSASDDDLVEGVGANKYAIGFFGYAYYQQDAQHLKILSIEGVKANAESAESGKYPLARPLFIYTDANIIRQKPQVAVFINFYLTNVNEEIEKVGYFPASQRALDEAKTKLLKAMGLE